MSPENQISQFQVLGSQFLLCQMYCVCFTTIGLKISHVARSTSETGGPATCQCFQLGNAEPLLHHFREVLHNSWSNLHEAAHVGSVWLPIAHVLTKNQVFDKGFISSQLYFDGKSCSSSQILRRYKFGWNGVLGCPLGRKWSDQWWSDQWVSYLATDTCFVRWSEIPSRELTCLPDKAYLKMIFLFPRWDMLISWRVTHLRYQPLILTS